MLGAGMAALLLLAARRAEAGAFTDDCSSKTSCEECLMEGAHNFCGWCSPGPVIYASALYVNDTAGVTKEHYLLLHEKADPAQTATEFCNRHGVPSEACAEVLAKLQRAKKELKPHNKVIFETGIRVKEGSCTNGAPLVLYEGEPPLLRAEMFCALYHPIEGCDAIHRKLQSAHDAHAAAAKVAARFGPG